MSDFSLAPAELAITATPGAPSTYEFGRHIAKHHFSAKCGIYPLHQTMRNPRHYRINLGCVDGMNSSSLPFHIYYAA